MFFKIIIGVDLTVSDSLFHSLYQILILGLLKIMEYLGEAFFYVLYVCVASMFFWSSIMMWVVKKMIFLCFLAMLSQNLFSHAHQKPT